MNQSSEPGSRPAAEGEQDGSDPPRTTEEVKDAADDPASDKRTTGASQAAENRELDPPA